MMKSSSRPVPGRTRSDPPVYNMCILTTCTYVQLGAGHAFINQGLRTVQCTNLHLFRLHQELKGLKELFRPMSLDRGNFLNFNL